MKNMLKKFQSEEGFDLVQILVAVAILAAIAVVAVLLLLGQVDKGKETATKSNVNNAITAAKIFATENLAPTATAWPDPDAPDYVLNELGDPSNVEVIVATAADDGLAGSATGDLVISVTGDAPGGAIIDADGAVERIGAAQ